MTIRQLLYGEPTPLGVPRRYKNAKGYIRLRWRTGPKDYVEVYEHRLVADAPDGVAVHHLNGNKSDNRPENLQILTLSVHASTHHPRRISDPEIAAMYQSGLTIPAIHRITGWDTGNISRSLKRLNVMVVQGERNRISLDEQRILELYHQGTRVAQIAKLLGVGRDPITRMLKRYGLPSFPSGRPY